MIRIGHGYDVHAFAEGRKCIIGGVELPCEKGLLGHSDADVLLHAIADSLLGALALGDIGKFFPDTDPRFAGIDSMVLLRETYARVQKEGYHLVNVDSVVIAQTPRLSPYIDKMRENIASALQTTPDFISVKATTEENLGFTGRKEGIAAHAVCLLEK